MDSDARLLPARCSRADGTTAHALHASTAACWHLCCPPAPPRRCRHVCSRCHSYIFMVPRGPRLVRRISARDLAAVQLMLTACLQMDTHNDKETISMLTDETTVARHPPARLSVCSRSLSLTLRR